VSPFHSGTLWIYRDPARDFRKVSDFDVQSWRPGLRELYERSGAAFQMARAILAGRGGGGDPGLAGKGAFAGALSLAERSLDALENAGEELCERIGLHFLWNWAILLGSGPDPEHCGSCACGFDHDGVSWFVPGEGLLCKKCAFQERAAFSGAAFGGIGPPLGPEARRWLLAARDAPPGELAGRGLDAASLGELKVLVKHLGLGLEGGADYWRGNDESR
jgi:DNA repair protein RecO (recombination protein O)